jgi:hypothetical protein
LASNFVPKKNSPKLLATDLDQEHDADDWPIALIHQISHDMKKTCNNNHSQTQQKSCIASDFWWNLQEVRGLSIKLSAS